MTGALIAAALFVACWVLHRSPPLSAYPASPLPGGAGRLRDDGLDDPALMMDLMASMLAVGSSLERGLDVLARSGRPLSELASVVVKLPQVLRNVRVADRAGLPNATAFWAEVASVEAELGAGGRVLVRPSGTEPLVRVMVEASTAEAATAYTDRLEAALTAVLGEFG